MDHEQVHKIHDQIEASVDTIEIGQGLKNLSNGYGAGKCFSCTSGWIIRIARKNEPIVRCRAADPDVVVPHDIIECNRYDRKGELDIWTLIKMHNPVDLSKPEAVMGFKTNEQSPETPGV